MQHRTRRVLPLHAAEARLDPIEHAVKAGVPFVAMEKPIALSSREAMAIKALFDGAGTRAVVCHQHRYGAHYQQVRAALRREAVGRVHTVYGTALGWMMHLLSHLVEYMRWFNDDSPARWVFAQAAGRGKLADDHPSPDYLAGFIHFANGVRGIVECGAGAPDVPEVGYWWHKNRLGAQGTEGFAEVLTGGGWRVVGPDGLVSGSGRMDPDRDMPGYIADIASWLDDEDQVHPCRFDSAYHGFEIMMALCRSVLGGGQITLPLDNGMDELAALARKLPARRVLPAH